MTVARSSGAIPFARSQKRDTASSEAPEARTSSKERAPVAGVPSICTTCSRPGQSRRTPTSIAACSGVSATATRLPESRTWNAIWAAVRVVYTGTSMAPRSSTARSTMCHSGRFSDISITRSPDSTPSRARPWARAAVCSSISLVENHRASPGR